jgi:hypothetical protein
VTVSAQLPGSAIGYKKRHFYVLPACLVPLLLGPLFLKETEVLSKNRHVLESCPRYWCSMPSVLWIGSLRNRMKCSLDGHGLEPIADYGSDLNMMSSNCAKRHGSHIDRRREARRRIRLEMTERNYSAGLCPSPRPG